MHSVPRNSKSFAGNSRCSPSGRSQANRAETAQPQQRVRPMFEAMTRVDRAAFGFTPVASAASIRLAQRPANRE
jgi:hypothetical protein